MAYCVGEGTQARRTHTPLPRSARDVHYEAAEGQASDQTIKAIAGHVSQRMLEHYSRIRMDAKRRALDAITQPSELGALMAGVHQNGNQVAVGESAPAAKLLN